MALAGLQQRLFKWSVDDATQVVDVAAQGIAVWRLVTPELPLQCSARNHFGRFSNKHMQNVEKRSRKRQPLLVTFNFHGVEI